MAEYRAEFPNRYESVTLARQALVNFALSAGLSGPALADFESAIGEALANAVEHGHRVGSRLRVYANSINGIIGVEVSDDGPGFASWNTEYVRPKPNSPRGFGIFIMHMLMDRIEYSRGGSCVRLWKKLPIATSEGNQRRA